VHLFLDLAAMFLLIPASFAVGALIWFLVKKDPEPLLGVYSQPGRPIIGFSVVGITACIFSFIFNMKNMMH